MEPIRICYQSYVDYEHGAAYLDAMAEHFREVVDPGTTVDIKTITPFDSYAHPLVEMRCAREMVCNAVAAEREGYDAFVVGHFQDAGLYEARTVVDIPVTALGEATMLFACQLGQRIGIITINPRFIPWFRHQIGKYGLDERVTGVHAMTFEPGQILAAFDSPAGADEVKALFAGALLSNVVTGIYVTHYPGGWIVVKNAAYAARGIIGTIATNHHTAMLGETHANAATMVQRHPSRTARGVQ